MSDPFLDKLKTDGIDLDIREPVIDVDATIRKLNLGSRYRLPPRGTYARQRRVVAICEQRGVSPVYRVEQE